MRAAAEGRGLLFRQIPRTAPMTWRGERRKQLPPDWPQRRKTRLAIDGGICTWIMGPDTEVTAWNSPKVLAGPGDRCPLKATDVDHWFASDRHAIEDLRSLCKLHHKQKTQREAQQARGVGPLRWRPKTKHPGLR